MGAPAITWSNVCARAWPAAPLSTGTRSGCPRSGARTALSLVQSPVLDASRRADHTRAWPCDIPLTKSTGDAQGRKAGTFPAAAAAHGSSLDSRISSATASACCWCSDRQSAARPGFGAHVSEQSASLSHGSICPPRASRSAAASPAAMESRRRMGSVHLAPGAAQCVRWQTVRSAPFTLRPLRASFASLPPSHRQGRRPRPGVPCPRRARPWPGRRPRWTCPATRP